MAKQRILNKELESNFTGIFIPKEVWLCEELTPIQMLLMMQIKSLDNKFGCKATNARFAEFFGVSDGTISEHIQNLAEKDFLDCEYDESNRRTMRISRKFKFIIAGLDEDLENYAEQVKEEKTFGKPKTYTEKPETSSENIEHRITLRSSLSKNKENFDVVEKKEEILANPLIPTLFGPIENLTITEKEKETLIDRAVELCVVEMENKKANNQQLFGYMKNCITQAMREFDTTKKTNTTIQKAEYYESKKNNPKLPPNFQNQTINTSEYQSKVVYQTL